ncbi:venom allergen 3 homolog [Odontomachus brunneus]|uniref:venom allergen 3 homolog n=1 Tax=Odontomachus brunneus TaxID=486640 RepID=UPI0013F1C46C|nr:venom allergen 3 homolog [Odontomachus brunneus]
MFSWMLFFTVIIAGAYAEDYCNLEICSIREKPHTMCQYPSPQPSQECGNWKRMGLSDAERQEILNMHNKLRRKVAAGKETRGNPGPQRAALNMPDLAWDDELEMIAQRWANQCIYEHDDNYGLCHDVDRFLVGQNLAVVDTSNENNRQFEECTQQWIDEVNSFDRNDVYKLPENFDPTGHYTQMVSDTANKIGCGKIVYDLPNNWKRLYCVCNYGASSESYPAGNVYGQPIYKTKE